MAALPAVMPRSGAISARGSSSSAVSPVHRNSFTRVCTDIVPHLQNGGREGRELQTGRGSYPDVDHRVTVFDLLHVLQGVEFLECRAARDVVLCGYFVDYLYVHSDLQRSRLNRR